MTMIFKRYDDGHTDLVARTFGVDDAGKVIDDEGESLFDDPEVLEIVITRDKEVTQSEA